MTNQVAERAEQARDLRQQISGLEASDQREIVFRDTSPARRKVTFYSTVDGEKIVVPEYMMESVIGKRRPDGEFMFTADKAKAPNYKRGTVKCFLHPDSPDRVILNEIGLAAAICPADTLGNMYSKRVHALHRHRQEWAMYQEHLSEERQVRQDDQQNKQTEAMLALATGASGAHGSDWLDAMQSPVVTEAIKVAAAEGVASAAERTRESLQAAVEAVSAPRRGRPPKTEE